MTYVLHLGAILEGSKVELTACSWKGGTSTASGALLLLLSKL